MYFYGSKPCLTVSWGAAGAGLGHAPRSLLGGLGHRQHAPVPSGREPIPESGNEAPARRDTDMSLPTAIERLNAHLIGFVRAYTFQLARG